MKQLDLFNKEDDFLQKAEEYLAKMEQEISELEEQERFFEESQAFEWAEEFPQICDKDGNFEGFDVVIGNPPYVQLRDLKNGKYYSENNKYYEIAKGSRMNLFQLFIPLAFDIVKKKSYVSLIVQNSFLQEMTTEKVRNYVINNYKILKIDSFPERDNKKRRVFKEAKMSVCVLNFQKIKTWNYNFDFRIWKERQFINHSFVSYFINDISNKYDNKIPLFTINRKYIYDRILKTIQDKEIIKIDIYSGEIDISKYNFFFSNNKKLPLIIKGAQVLRYQTTNKPSQGTVNYLNIKKAKINKNSKGRLIHHKKTRIAMQRITGVDSKIRLIMTFIDENIFCANSVNYIFENKNYSLKYILALLNSKLFNYYFKIFSTNTNITTTEIKKLPIIKIIDYEIYENKVNKILKLKKETPKADTLQLENEIDMLVYKLYNLTKEEIKIIENENHN